MKHIWSVLCKRSVIDNKSNLISLFDCLEQVNVKLQQQKNEYGATIPMEFELVSLYLKESVNQDEEVEILVELYDPNGIKLKGLPMNFTIPQRAQRFRNMIKIDCLPVTIGGIYIFKIKFKNKHQNKYQGTVEIPLEVRIEGRE